MVRRVREAGHRGAGNRCDLDAFAGDVRDGKKNLADRILLLIQEHPKVHLTSNVETVRKTIADTIFANMREEDEIEGGTPEAATIGGKPKSGDLRSKRVRCVRPGCSSASVSQT